MTISVTSRMIPLSLIDMPARPLRSRVDADRVRELTASIRKVGQLEPALVRETGAGRYQIVAGHKRALAVAAAGLDLLEVKVAPYGLDAAIAENTARRDLTPVEEARAYQRLVDEDGLDVAEIAARCGRPPAHVAGRLRLASLDADTIALLAADRIGYAGAALLAGVSADTRAKVVAQMQAARFVQTFSVADIIDRLEDVARELDDAPFDTADEALSPAIGACTRCPHNTGTQRDLFEARTATCLDVPCFREKARRSTEQRRDAALAKGVTVIEGEAAERVVRGGSGYVRLEAPAMEYARAHPDAGLTRAPSWYEVLTASGREDIVPVLVVHEEGGAPRASLYLRERDKARLLGAVDEAASDEAAKDAEVDDPDARAKAEAKAKRAEEVEAITLRRLAETLADPSIDGDTAMYIACRALVAATSQRHLETLTLRREWAKKGADYAFAIEEHVRRDLGLAFGVIAEIVLYSERVALLSKASVGTVVGDLIEAIEIDVAAIKGEVRRDLAKRDDEEAAKAGKGRVRKRRPKKAEQVEITETAPATEEAAS